MRRILLFLFFVAITSAKGFGQEWLQKIQQADWPGKIERVEYKQVDTTRLFLTIYYPLDFSKSKKYPAVAFFFGGGWVNGSIAQFEPHAKYFAQRGMVSILVDYRIRNRNGTTPFDAVRDAKSAIRFIRANAKKFHIKKHEIVAAGGSAGGHLAAAAGNINGLEEPSENQQISSRPNALVLFNPVFNNGPGPGSYGYDRIGDRYREISPMHNIAKGAPPTIVFLGTKDHLIPVSTAETYKSKMDSVGSKCELFLYDGQDHGFFNYRNLEYFEKTVREADHFLSGMGYIKGAPLIQ